VSDVQGARIPIDEQTRILVLTGAGISAESGLATFRGAGGLWDGHPVEQVASPEGFEADPELVWRFYSMRRRDAAAAEPKPPTGLAALRTGWAIASWLPRTWTAPWTRQPAHGRGHGPWRTRCSACMRPAFVDSTFPVEPPLPRCACGALLRPDIVWFGELLDAADTQRIDRFMRETGRSGDPFVFLAVGTSGNVYPAAGYVTAARFFGARTWLANLDAAENAGAFDHLVEGPAGSTLPGLLGVDG
jgi:NAD-dependent deacetylase